MDKVTGICLLLLAYKYYFLLPSDEAKLFLGGIGLYLLSTLIIGTKGMLFGIVKRVDVFHVMLVFANWSFTQGILLQRNSIIP